MEWSKNVGMSKKSVTLLEVIVSVMILALVYLGIAGVFVAGKRYVQNSRFRMTGGEIGKYFLDPFQNDVNEQSWGTPGNRLGSQAALPTNVNINMMPYSGVYTINRLPISNNLTKVKVVITLPDPG